VCKIGQGPWKGSLVTATQRVRVGDSTFLRIDGGWIFDTKQGRKMVDGPIDAVSPPIGTVRRVEAAQPFKLTNGLGSGECAPAGLRYRRSPCLTDTDGMPCAPWGSAVNGELINEHWVRVGEHFLPVKLNGTTVLRRNGEPGVRLTSAPTRASWAVTKFFVLDKAQVQVTLVCTVEGTRWARVATVGGNMEGWLHARLLADPGDVVDEMPSRTLASVP